MSQRKAKIQKSMQRIWHKFLHRLEVINHLLYPTHLYKNRIRLRIIKSHIYEQPYKTYLIHYNNPPNIKPVERIEKVSVQGKTVIGCVSCTRHKGFINDIEINLFEDSVDLFNIFANDLNSLGISIKWIDKIKI